MYPMNPTREAILQSLRAHGQRTVSDLAGEVGISPASIRHHLNSLQAGGMIAAQEVRRGVGRPRLPPTRTSLAHAHFPARYVKLSERLLEEIKAHLPPATIGRIFADIAAGIVAEHSRALAGKTLEEKLPLLVDLLGAEGFMTAWDRVGEHYRLTQNNCPYFHVSQRHPEVCTIDQTLISELLALPVQKNSCLLNGDSLCTFTVPAGSAAA